MKRGLLYLIAFLSIFSIARAQSDYEIVEAFKDSLASIGDSIKLASSLEECDSLIVNLNKLQNDFIEYKTLLDQSLYPDDFNSSIEKLKSLIQLRRNDFSQIVKLEDQSNSCIRLYLLF